jgi:hypothetical protein
MKRLLTAALACLAPLAVFAQSPTTNSGPAIPVIGASQATEFMDKTVAVTGVVAQVSQREKINYLNLDEKFPQSPLAVIVFPSATNRFPALTSYLHQQVKVTGPITAFHDRPQIVVTNGTQIEVLKAPDAGGK